VNYDTPRLAALEARFERLLLAIADLQAAIGRVQQPEVNAAGSGQNSGGVYTPLFWAHAPSTVAAATGSWPTLTPSTFTSDVYSDTAGALVLQATSQTVRWFYKDSAASGSLIPVMPTDNGTAWDAIGNSCTPV
jgi:hypothetical protein